MEGVVELRRERHGDERVRLGQRGGAGAGQGRGLGEAGAALDAKAAAVGGDSDGVGEAGGQRGAHALAAARVALDDDHLGDATAVAALEAVDEAADQRQRGLVGVEAGLHAVDGGGHGARALALGDGEHAGRQHPQLVVAEVAQAGRAEERRPRRAQRAGRGDHAIRAVGDAEVVLAVAAAGAQPEHRGGVGAVERLRVLEAHQIDRGGEQIAVDEAQLDRGHFGLAFSTTLLSRMTTLNSTRDALCCSRILGAWFCSVRTSLS